LFSALPQYLIYRRALIDHVDTDLFGRFQIAIDRRTFNNGDPNRP
jgi:hypothetical protein